VNYRDDREALRGEVDNLQQELAAARADQERLRQIEQRLEAAKREIHALEAEVGKQQRKTGPRGALIVLSMALAGIVVAAGAAAFLLVQSPAKPPLPLAPMATALPIMPGIAMPTPVPRPAETATEPSAASSREVQLKWSATVTKSNAAGVPAGSTCQIGARGVPDSSGMHVVDVKVTCGAQTIYDQASRLNGTSQIDSDAKQRPGPRPKTWVYDLIFSDVGTRSATRNQAQLDASLKLGKVWSENLPEFRVDLAITSGSDPVDVAILDPGE
jgi:hypothetical protein